MSESFRDAVEKSQYGAVVFDDDTRPSSGWASINGKPAFKIRGLGDLPSDVYFWTNLPMTTVVGYVALNNKMIKRDDYLKPSMKQLHAELGLSGVKRNRAKVAEVSAEIFMRVMKLAFRNYGLIRPHESVLTDDLFDLLVKRDEPINERIDTALKESYQNWSTCHGPMPEKSKVVTLRRPRIKHAIDVLSTPIPGNDWNLIEDRLLPDETKIVDWLLKRGTPVLVKAAIKSVQFEYSNVISFGSGASSARNWMSSPELLMMHHFSNVKIKEVWEATEYERKPVNKEFSYDGHIGTLSISNGILAENYWIALATSRSFKKHTLQKSETVFSPRAVWLAATDRFHSVIPALEMSGAGFSVKGYGRGKITVAVRDGEFEDAKECALEAGLTSPLLPLEE